MSESRNGHLECERIGGTLLVYVPKIMWYQLNVPYTSELERLLAPAIEGEEKAILVAPDKTTGFFLKLERFPSYIPVIVGEKEAKARIEADQHL